VGVVLLHASGVFHGNEDDSEVVLFEESPGVVAGLPWLLLFGVGDLFEKVELRHLGDHGAVLQRGCHVRTLLSGEQVYAFYRVRCDGGRTERADVSYTYVSLSPKDLSERFVGGKNVWKSIKE